MPPSNDSPAHRSPAELRIAFKSMTAQRLPRATALSTFDLLWDEVNHAAASQSNTVSLTAYVALLKEMQGWYSDELRGPA
jgi:hypothetical protein